VLLFQELHPTRSIARRRAVKFSLKPVFVGWIALLAQIPIQLFFTLWAGGFVGALLAPFFREGSRLPFLIAGGFVFFAIPLVIYVSRKWNYRRTDYQFYDDRLEFEEGFFTIQKKTIKYRDVREVTLRRGILQRMYGLGSIYLGTLATGTQGFQTMFSALGFGNVSASGIVVRDISDPEEAYRRIKGVIDLQD
jgi:membrane protein YdbS with pleckstrin-like domain